MGALSSLVPLVILLAVVGGGAYIGYQVYLWSNELADRGQKHMEKKNMSFTKDGGLRVGVKEMNAEEAADRTQKAFVNTWNASGDHTSRPSSSRTASGNNVRPGVERAASSGLQAPVQRGSAKRGSSQLPGGW